MTGGSEEVQEKPRSVEEVAAVSIVTDLRMDRGGLAISQTATQLLPSMLSHGGNLGEIFSFKLH